MIHFRIVAPAEAAACALELLEASPSATNVIHLPKAAMKPVGDVILCDVAREDASVILGDLRELGIDELGSIAMEMIDGEVSRVAENAERAARGAPSDAVIWEEVESRTSENVELSFSFVAFTVIAMLIAAVGIILDSPILIVGAMVVGPEFGPIAGFCVAVVQLRAGLARRSLLALGVSFPIGIIGAYLVTEATIALGVAPDQGGVLPATFTNFISRPDAFSFLVAFVAGVAGILSLTSAKSGPLIGVVISVTTVPAAANIAVSAAYSDWSQTRGSALQLVINLLALTLAGIATLYLQRLIYLRRRRAHLGDPNRASAGLPLGRSVHQRRS